MLKYQWLNDFDEDMVKLTKENHIFRQRMADMLLMKAPEQTCAFYRNGLLFVFNFHFEHSLNHVLVPVHQPGEYTVVLSSDDAKYGGFENVKHQTYSTKAFDGRNYIELYIPARTCFVLKEKVILPPEPVKEAPAAEPVKEKEISSSEPVKEAAPETVPEKPAKKPSSGTRKRSASGAAKKAPAGKKEPADPEKKPRKRTKKAAPEA